MSLLSSNTSGSYRKSISLPVSGTILSFYLKKGKFYTYPSYVCVVNVKLPSADVILD